MSTTPSASSSEQEATTKYVCGIDIGSQSCSSCITRPDKSVVVKPITFANTQEGWRVLEEKLRQLDAAPNQIVIGMEATSRYHENLYHDTRAKGLPDAPVASWTNPSLSPATGLASQDRPAGCKDYCPRFARDGEARMGYIPSEQVATYRELVRLHTQSLAKRLPAIRTRSRPWWSCFFPSSARSRLDPAYPVPWQCGNTYPHAQAVAEAGVEAVYQVLRAVPAAHFGRPTAKKLVAAAQASIGSGRALPRTG